MTGRFVPPLDGTHLSAVKFAKSLVDDLLLSRAVVLSRTAASLRSIETGRFVPPLDGTPLSVVKFAKSLLATIGFSLLATIGFENTPYNVQSTENNCTSCKVGRLYMCLQGMKLASVTLRCVVFIWT